MQERIAFKPAGLCSSPAECASAGPRHFPAGALALYAIASGGFTLELHAWEGVRLVFHGPYLNAGTSQRLILLVQAAKQHPAASMPGNMSIVAR